VNDSEDVLHFISDMLVNEFGIALDFGGRDCDLLKIEQHYNKDGGGCFWVTERIDNNQIIGTAAIRKLEGFTSAIENDASAAAAAGSCELKRMFLSKPYRGLGIGQQMLENALNFAKSHGYAKVYLYSSRDLAFSRKLYLKNGFADIPRYNDDPRADVFMEKNL
jgi:GNAT superfamily N-acetyltransferase